MLKARWPHFAQVFRSGMKESKTNRINLEATSEATEALLKFLYTDELECDTRTVCEVMILSDMYLLDNLK